MIPLILQVVPELPKQGLSEEWAVWIIGTLISFIGFIFFTIKWLVDKVFSKVDSVLNKVFDKVDKLEARFENMHKEATTELKCINMTLVDQSNKMQSFEKNLEETKYAIQNIDCANEKIMPIKKRA